TAEVGVQTGDDYPLAQVRQLVADVDYFFTQELGFVDADDFGAGVHLFHDFRGFGYVVGGDAQAGVGDDFVRGAALGDGRLKDLDALAGDFRTAEAADEFFTFAGEHWTDDYFDPAH